MTRRLTVQAAPLPHPEVETPRLVVLAPDPWGLGGIQLVTRTLLSSLADLFGAERVGLLQLWDHGVEPDICRLLYRGVRPAHKATGRVTFSQRITYVLAAVRHARRWNHNLVLVAAHAHLAPVAWLAAAISRRPYTVWCHGHETWGPLRFGVRHALKHADAVFTSNRFTAARVEQLAGLTPGTVHVFPYGLPSGYKPISSNGDQHPRVLAVARLAPEDAYKGIDGLICAWPQVVARVPDAQLEIVGDGPDRPRLMKMAEILSLDGTIRFAGRLSDEELQQAYARTAVFAMPGRHSAGPPAQGEGFGMVFVEAGAAGLPVVAGRAAGAMDAVAHDESGLLVEPNDPGDVADAIVRLLTDPELAKRLGQGGRERAAGKFSYPVFKENIGVLVRSIDGRPAGLTS
jgi:phosphatidyl-myo-inositol dimannoside synthase